MPALPGATGDLSIRVRIETTLQIRSPSLISTFITYQVTLAFRILFAISLAFITILVATRLIGLLQLFAYLGPVICCPIRCFGLFGLVAWLIDDHFAVIVVGGQRMVQHCHALRLALLVSRRQELELFTRKVNVLEVLLLVVLVTGTQDEVPVSIPIKAQILRLGLHQTLSILDFDPFPAVVLLVGAAVRCYDVVALLALEIAAHYAKIIPSGCPLYARLIV
mmetsp:Transcript_8443/g.19048  ORF Transcript_8443/g.19048 Transcript_8443/m.19048 type:complete len:222 (+) Transcript_8443:197-862(+)